MKSGHVKDSKYDVIVIGAGPAGCEIAYRLARSGHKVLVLEKESFGREKPCGGGIQLKEMLEFGNVPSEVIERKIRKARIVSPSNIVLEAELKNSRLFAATVKRSNYDMWLQSRAEKAGAELIDNTAVTSIKDKGGSSEIKAGDLRFNARLVVDAGGASSSVRRMIGIKERFPELCVTFHRWLKLKDIGRRFSNAIELYFMKDNPEGYVWIFPKKDVVSVGIGATAVSVRKKKLNMVQMLDEFIRKHPVASARLKGAVRKKEWGGMVPMGILPRLWSNNAVVIGDSGGFANIIQGGGIYQARKSAKIAAKHCVRYLKTRDSSHLEAYDKEARAWFEDYETKWDRKIRNLLWNPGIVDQLAEKGGNDEKIKEALGIVLTSARPHERAYRIIEGRMLDMIYSELERITKEYRRIVDPRLKKIFRKDNDLHIHTNEVLLNDKAKRLRAFIGILASEMFRGNRDDAVDFSLIYEIFHTASLVHDDIIDESSKRRGRKTLHEKYGIDDAIITGDIMLSKGYSLISRFSSRLSKEQIRSLLDIVGKTGEKCCIGQSLDIRLSARRQYKSIKDYIDMIGLKTGSLIEGAVKGGAVVAGASDKQVRIIGRFGMNMGIAFQIIDDSLDLLGGAKANKSVMNDLRQGKATPMLIHALNNADKKDKEKILKTAGNKSMRPKTANEIVDIYRRCGAIEFAQKLSHDHIEKARKELRTLPDGGPKDKFNRLLDIMDYWSLMGA
ncbi:geranylgeranyl reductase family protein [Candidatus Woesearchaeota archaeon]|nr:geranylgeranyl reductase family protein [Candidatus Woesearchaeota archaeon]